MQFFHDKGCPMLIITPRPQSLPWVLLYESHYDVVMPLWRHNADHVFWTIHHGDRSNNKWIRISPAVDQQDVHGTLYLAVDGLADYFKLNRVK